MSRVYTYLAVQSGGHFNDACIRKGYIKPEDCCVIEWQQFIKFMNEGEVTRPMFASPQYGVCLEVAKELNESASQIASQEYVAESNL